jgi:DNA polymerase-1
MCIPFIVAGQDYFDPGQEVEIMRLIAAILQDEGIEKIGQNLAFDSTFMFTRYHIVVRNMTDTMIGQAIAFPDYPKGLDFITSVYTKEPYYKDDGKRWFKLGGNDREFWVYNAKDSVVCMESWPKIFDNLDKLHNVETYTEQAKLIPSLSYMQHRGIRFDKEAADTENKRVTAEIGRLSEELNSKCGYAINHNSPKQLIEYFYIKRGEKPYVDRKTKKPTTDEDALKRLLRKGYAEAGTILELRHLSKLKGTYLDVTLDTDGRLRCSFNPVGTKQGRLSSSETIFDTGTNLQNLPEEFRRFLIADEDTLMFNVDLSQAENRIVAYIAPEPNMIHAFENKIDLHVQTASLISGVSLDEIARQDKEDIHCHLGSGSYTWRFWGKKGNHSLNYDLGEETFSLRFELPRQDSKFIINRYHQVYPGVRQYHAWVRNLLFKNRTLINLYGRRRMFTDRWGDDMFREAYSYIPQSSVADIINRRGLNNMYYDQTRFKPVDLLLQVHDSILFQMNFKLYSYEKMAEVLINLVNDLEQPLVWGTREFVIPANVTVGTCFYKKKMIGVETNGQTIAGLARRLSEIHGQLRAPVHV